jgi:hypothetical protein
MQRYPSRQLPETAEIDSAAHAKSLRLWNVPLFTTTTASEHAKARTLWEPLACDGAEDARGAGVGVLAVENGLDHLTERHALRQRFMREKARGDAVEANDLMRIVAAGAAKVNAPLVAK